MRPSKEFEYRVHVEWMGNDGRGTAIPGFSRDNEIAAAGRPTITGSAPPEFGGDGKHWSPEELFVAAVSQCHMLTYLFVCTRAGIVVDSYRDDPVGTLAVGGPDGGQFRSITLRPTVVISAGDPILAQRLHEEASNTCFIGRSVRTPVLIEGAILMRPAAA